MNNIPDAHQDIIDSLVAAQANIKQHQCPITGEDTPTYSEQYPSTVSSTAQQRAVDDKGRSVAFFNASMGGGLLAQHKNQDGTIEEDSNARCWIDGIACTAVEFRTGGVGVIPLT